MDHHWTSTRGTPQVLPVKSSETWIGREDGRPNTEVRSLVPEQKKNPPISIFIIYLRGTDSVISFFPLVYGFFRKSIFCESL